MSRRRLRHRSTGRIGGDFGATGQIRVHDFCTAIDAGLAVQSAQFMRSISLLLRLSAQIQQKRNDYYKILETTQKGDLDITGWLDWFLGCPGRAFEGAETILASVLAKSRFWKMHADASFNGRQRTVINRLLDGFEGKLTSSKWAKLTKSSQGTALRDIDDLVWRGVLKKDPAGGRSTSYSLTEAD